MAILGDTSGWLVDDFEVPPPVEVFSKSLYIQFADRTILLSIL